MEYMILVELIICMVFQVLQEDQSGFISASIADDSLYGDNISVIFPGREDGRTSLQQGFFQLAALGTTLGISILGGIITGFIVKHIEESNEYFEDNENWEYENIGNNDLDNVDENHEVEIGEIKDL